MAVILKVAVTKRPGSMSDDDRALAHKSQTPAVGVPVHAPQDEDFTPVSSVIERVQAVFVPNEREQMVLTLVWQHTANMELRARQRSETSGAAALERRVDGVETAIVDIRGEHGNNGKLGALKARVDTAESRKWWALTFVAGLLVTVITAAVTFGVWIGRIDADVATLKQRANRARGSSSPDYPAARETP